jgi:hypothetical protein
MQCFLCAVRTECLNVIEMAIVLQVAEINLRQVGFVDSADCPSVTMEICRFRTITVNCSPVRASLMSVRHIALKTECNLSYRRKYVVLAESLYH